MPYDSATPDDLADTMRLVEEVGREIVAELGPLDIIVANAGISAPQA